MRTLDEMLANQLMCLCLLAFEDELAHLLQVFFCLTAIVVMRSTRPEGLFIELYLFGIRSAIDHGSEMGVANRQGLQPMGGWLGVPQSAVLSVNVDDCHQHRDP